MVGIAFDLDRAPFVALHQHRNGASGKRHRGGVVERLARYFFFRLPHVRHDVLNRLLGARAQSSQRERCAHDLQETTAGNIVGPFGSMPREFAVQHLLEAFGVGKLVETAPVGRPGGIRQRVADFRQVERLRRYRLLREFSFAIVAQSQFPVFSVLGTRYSQLIDDTSSSW